MTSVCENHQICHDLCMRAVYYAIVALVELPSKLGHLAYPIKVYRNRMRGHNQPYDPDIAYQGNIDDTDALGQWFLTEVINQI